MFIYHERQLGGLCGVHCLNNLLQGPLFGPGDLAEIGVQLDKEEQMLLSGGGQGAGLGNASPTSGTVGDIPGSDDAVNHQPYNVDPSADGGNFSIQVLDRALRKFGIELLPAKHPGAKDLMKDPPKAAEAFLCQYKDHWFAVREVAECWWNLNSTRSKPGLVSPFYLAAWLGQLSAEGYSIFLLRGSKLPEPAKPNNADAPKEENFHELSDLLEQARQPNERPLQGGEACVDPVVIPPELDYQQSCPSTFSMQPNAPLLPSAVPDVVESQRRLLEQARTGNRPVISGADAVNASNSVVETQRRLLEEAQKRRVVNASNSVVETQRRLLEEAQRAAAASSRSPPSKSWPSGTGASRGGVVANSSGVPEAADLPFTEPAGSWPPAPPRPPRSLRSGDAGAQDLPPKALLEMGFKEPQVRVAQLLAHHGPSNVSDLLLRVKSVDAAVERDAGKLANAIQDAVMQLDRAEVSRAAVLQLVTLLCVDDGCLTAACAHTDLSVLAEFLLSIVAKRGERWAPEFSKAAVVIVELLKAAPPAGGRKAGGVADAGGAEVCRGQGPSSGGLLRDFAKRGNTGALPMARGDAPAAPQITP